MIVWVSAFGRVDFKGLVQCVTKKEASRVIRYITEDAKNQIQLEKKSGGRISIVIDFEHLSMKQICNKRGKFVHNNICNNI